jgi:prepilin-type N-terminal cleavage/methylation domain-containing protein
MNPSLRKSQRMRQKRAYTIIEVMVAIALLAVAASGIVALQKVTLVSSARGKNLAIAAQLGRTWVERLRGDAVVWNFPSPAHPGVPSDLAQTRWLQRISTAPNTWFRPDFVDGRGSAGFDPLGNDVSDAAISDATFCTHLRLAWLYPGTVMRADVRVFWLREGGPGPSSGDPICGPTVSPEIFDPAYASAFSPIARFHTSYFSTSIMQNTAP